MCFTKSLDASTSTIDERFSHAFRTNSFFSLLITNLLFSFDDRVVFVKNSLDVLFYFLIEDNISGPIIYTRLDSG